MLSHSFTLSRCRTHHYVYYHHQGLRSASLSYSQPLTIPFNKCKSRGGHSYQHSAKSLTHGNYSFGAETGRLSPFPTCIFNRHRRGFVSRVGC
ncbi:hypothetical protein CEXT_570731 [Caerostris extrusa]|uniref:Uncharacterized protein n=1 Tax=Caerostris extrusa TaxID=172846 RepID=A0AAV4XZ67_CAEEX|nr:hypothetical protein CEXT_570731 [Caerostris extrusa]